MIGLTKSLMLSAQRALIAATVGVCGIAFAAPLAPASSSAVAGEVILQTGVGTATDPGSGAIRQLEKGAAVHSGEILNTGANSYMNLRFSDGAFVLLRPNTRFEIAQYAYSGPAPAASAPAPVAPVPTATPAAQVATPAPATAATTVVPETPGLQRAFLHLLKGGFRTISGLIGKTNHDGYQVTTPVATIGIRGTDYYVYICDLACASDPIVASSLAGQNIDSKLAVGATLSGVLGGSIAITNAAGQEEVLLPGQFLLTLTNGQQIRLPDEPHFLRVSPFPNPLTMCPA